MVGYPHSYTVVSLESGAPPYDLSVLTRNELCAAAHSQFHDVHHEKVACNYGGFTTIYDRLFGTVYRGYDAKVLELKARIEGGPVSKQHKPRSQKQTSTLP